MTRFQIATFLIGLGEARFQVAAVLIKESVHAVFYVDPFAITSNLLKAIDDLGEFYRQQR